MEEEGEALRDIDGDNFDGKNLEEENAGEAVSMGGEEGEAEEEDVLANFYLRDDNLPKDQITWEAMFDAIEEAKTSELYRDTDEEEKMSVLSMSDEDEENAAIIETAAEGEM